METNMINPNIDEAGINQQMQYIIDLDETWL